MRRNMDHAGDYWPKELKDAYKELKLENEEYNKGEETARTQLKYANELHRKVFDKVKTYNKAKLEKFLEAVENAENVYQNKSDKDSGSIYANLTISEAVSGLRDDSLPKLIKGEYDKDTKSSKLKEITGESYRKSKEKHYGEDSKIEPNTFNEVDVGTLPPRDLGLVTEEEEESVNQTSPDTIIESADKFLTVGKQDEIDEDSLNKVSNTVYNILLAVAIALAVIIGIVLGIKFMTSGAEGQAKIKEALIPYIVGCLIAFSAFGIWKVIIIILNNV